MEPMTALAVGQGVGSLFGGVFGSGSRKRAARRARAVLEGTDVEAANAWADQVEDPAGRNAQLAALSGLQSIYGARGMDTGSRVALGQVRDAASQYERGQREAALARMAQTGRIGAGQELAARLGSIQTGANAVAAGGAQAVGDARLRALDALKGYGNMATNLRGDDFRFQSAKADAANAISMFNANQRWNKAQAIAGTHLGQGQASQQFATGLGSSIGAGLGALYGYATQPRKEVA